MTPAILRDALFHAGNRVPVETFLHGRKPHEVAAIRESMADLVEWGLAVDHGDAWQAVRGSGKLVEGVRSIRLQGPPGVFATPKMSEGSERIAARRQTKASQVIEEALPKLRSGMNLSQAGVCGGMQYWKVNRPKDWQRLVDALEEGKRLVESQRVTKVVAAVRAGNDNTLAVADACGMGYDLTDRLLEVSVREGLVLKVGKGNARRFRAVRRVAA